jgi:DNA polymerase-3 subunit epsilon
MLRTWFARSVGEENRPQYSETPVSLDAAKFVVLDLEMTGLDPKRDSIVALGGVKMTGARIEIGQTFSSLVRPRTKVSAASVRVHQLLPSELEQGDDSEDALQRFWAFCEGAALVGYCLDVDLPFLESEAKRLKLPPLGPRRIDTLHLYHALRDTRGSTLLEGLPPRNASLYDIAEALGISIRGAHDALGDAAIAAQVFQRFLWMLRAGRERELDMEELVAAGGRRRGHTRAEAMGYAL